MIIRSAKNTDKSQILALWQDCFHDPQEYIEQYLSKRFDPKYCVILEDKSEIVGMVHLLPCKISPDTNAFYWYAAGIKSTRRNEGLFRKFSSFLIEKINQAGFKSVCVPASGLENFYMSIGFRYKLTATDKTFIKNITESQTIRNSSWSSAKVEDFLCKGNSGDIIWDTNAIDYAIYENDRCEGKAYSVIIDNKKHSLFAIKKDDGFLIDYHFLSEKDFLQIKDDLFNLLACDRLIFRDIGTEKIIALTDSDLIKSDSKISMTLA